MTRIRGFEQREFGEAHDWGHALLAQTAPRARKLGRSIVWRGWTEMAVADTLIVYASILYRG